MIRRSLKLAQDFFLMRKTTMQLCEPLEIEDYVVQPTSEVSPPKWHLGHTTWFLEELILNRFRRNYTFVHPLYRKIYNSYYKGLGEHWVQGERGQLSRPTVAEVKNYRLEVDERMNELINKETDNADFLDVLELAIHHEEQHQELLLMDIKVILGANPALPAYIPRSMAPHKKGQRDYLKVKEGLYEIGASEQNFHFDNEGPRHKYYLRPFSLADTLVTNEEYLNFIKDGGHKNPLLWKSQGWDFITAHKISRPLFWREDNSEFTLFGEAERDPNAPVMHISYFEADAFARWAGMRLPTEFEFETASLQYANPARPSYKFLYHPESAGSLQQQLWCWSDSQYSPYPGFKSFKGKAQEYNGKFMCNQFVLKGGCINTPPGHYRHTYRNFYGPDQRWMYSGIALVRDER